MSDDGKLPRRRIRATAGRVAALVAITVIVAACGSGTSGASGLAAEQPDTPSSSASLGDPTTDKLAQVLDRGTLILSTDLEYPPQSMSVDGATRVPDTACAPNQLTGSEVQGYDADTGKAVADKLGVEPCFVVPSWTEITGGNWGDRWDVSWGSGSINADRMTRLWMTQPYYGVPNHYFVRSDSPYQTAADLTGREIGACASCSHEYFLKGELEIPGVAIELDVQDPQIVTFETETTGLQALADGDIDAFLAAAPVGQAQVDAGLDLRPLEKPAFTYFPSGFVDKGSGLAPTVFVQRINEIIGGLHTDGTLARLSEQYFGVDYAAAGARFDLDAIGQVLP